MRSASRIAFALALALCACGASGPTAPPAGGGTPLKVPVGTSPVDGPADAWVTVVVFSDFQCPYCGALQRTFATVLPEYGNDVRLVFKHFPLSFHRWARTTAVASECAHVQDRFWEFHDLVFGAQSTLFDGIDYESKLAAIAGQAGLDLDAWQACRGDPAMDARVVADLSLGSRVGVPGTPMSVVNGTSIVGNEPASAFRAAIESARTRAQASGVPAAQYYDQVVLGL
jgi:protein-disulfide isomerase